MNASVCASALCLLSFDLGTRGGVESTLRVSKRTINKQNKRPTYSSVLIVVPPNFGVLLYNQIWQILRYKLV